MCLFSSLQQWLQKPDVLEKVKETSHMPGQYFSYRDGSHYQENLLLSDGGEKLSIILYVDDFEIANPLGTSRKIHKVCRVYCTLANIPVKYRSVLHSTQLALLCNANDVRQFVYEKVFASLLADLKTFEEVGVYIEHLVTVSKAESTPLWVITLQPMGLLVSVRLSKLHISAESALPPRQKCRNQMP